jgi:hypothetical protein
MLKPIEKAWRYTCPSILKLDITPIIIKINNPVLRD